jgi:hypothetical protein
MVIIFKKIPSISDITIFFPSGNILANQVKAVKIGE